MTLLELQQQLIAIGFNISSNPFAKDLNDCTWYAYRRSKIPARECECNEKKFMQIVLKPLKFSMHGHDVESVEIEIVGQYDNWYNLNAYGISFEEVIEKLPKIEASLVAAWNALEIKD